ncbi:MAG: hypothetical protein H7Z42_12245 [Roseiflexaceae bacterium]|nr:hypothetical protein [Roseiflexaceae bacterium]
MRIPARLQFHLVLLAMLIALLAIPPAVRAIELPPPGVNMFIQTSGVDTSLNIGDFYTSKTGGNLADGHEFKINIPCDWPAALPVTFSIFDPEIGDPDPTGAQLAEDEVRNASGSESNVSNSDAGNSRFILRAPAGAPIADRTFTPNGGTNGLWVEVLTVDLNAPGQGCGVYQLNSTATSNDDNAWVLRVANDADCTVSPGTCSTVGATASALLGNDTRNDNPDNIAGSGDEPTIGSLRTSFQQYPFAPVGGADLTCQNFYTFVGLAQPTVTFHNFDLDTDVRGLETVRYLPPAGSSYPAAIAGSTSRNSRWNNQPLDAATPQRVGDTLAISARDVGWWAIEVCVQVPGRDASKNQFIVEASSGLLFLQQPATPVVQVAKDDGVSVAENGQSLTYVVSFANTSDTTATPGSAHNVTLADQLPNGTTYEACAIDAPYTGTCALNGRAVTFKLNEVVLPGARGSVRVTVKVDAATTGQIVNTVGLTYDDALGNPRPPVEASDTDTVRQPAPPTAVALAAFTVEHAAGASTVRWQTRAELATRGFYLLRGVDREQAVRVSPFIASQGANGGSYAWADSAALAGNSYWLEEIAEDGGQVYGPASAARAAAQQFKAFLPISLAATRR